MIYLKLNKICGFLKRKKENKNERTYYFNPNKS